MSTTNPQPLEWLNEAFETAFLRGTAEAGASAELLPDGKKFVEDWKATIAAHIEREIREAYDEGYEAGEKPHLPSILDAIDFRQEQYGWNDTKMAAMLDMQKSHFSEFKSGKRSLPINSIQKAYAIGIPTDVLLSDQLT